MRLLSLFLVLSFSLSTMANLEGEFECEGDITNENYLSSKLKITKEYFQIGHRSWDNDSNEEIISETYPRITKFHEQERVYYDETGRDIINSRVLNKAANNIEVHILEEMIFDMEVPQYTSFNRFKIYFSQAEPLEAVYKLRIEGVKSFLQTNKTKEPVIIWKEMGSINKSNSSTSPEQVKPKDEKPVFIDSSYTCSRLPHK